MKKLGANAVTFSEDSSSVLCKRWVSIFFQCNLRETSQRKRDCFGRFVFPKVRLYGNDPREDADSASCEDGSQMHNAQQRITSLSWMKQQRRALRLAVYSSFRVCDFNALKNTGHSGDERLSVHADARQLHANGQLC